MGNLTGETHSGITVSFSHEAYVDAMSRYRLKDIEEVVLRVERNKRRDRVSLEVANFFRDLAIIQEIEHPDYDRGVAIGSLATRIELATGQITAGELKQAGVDHEFHRSEYEAIFG